MKEKHHVTAISFSRIQPIITESWNQTTQASPIRIFDAFASTLLTFPCKIYTYRTYWFQSFQFSVFFLCVSCRCLHGQRYRQCHKLHAIELSPYILINEYWKSVRVFTYHFRQVIIEHDGISQNMVVNINIWNCFVLAFPSVRPSCMGFIQRTHLLAISGVANDDIGERKMYMEQDNNRSNDSMIYC